MAELIVSLISSKYVFLAVVNIILLLLGMLIEGTALIIILVPLLKPVMLQLGIDPVHFGLIMILNLSIGTLTPPVGTVMRSEERRVGNGCRCRCGRHGRREAGRKGGGAVRVR